MTMIKISDSIFNLKASDGFIQFARESKYSCKHQTAWEKTQDLKILNHDHDRIK